MKIAMNSVLHEFLNALDGVYQGVALWYGALAAGVGFSVCWLLPWQIRWVFPLLLLVTTVLAVVGAAHHYGRYSIGVAAYLLFSVIGLYVRAKQTGSTLWKQKPYDLILFVVAFVVASLVYDSPAA